MAADRSALQSALAQDQGFIARLGGQFARRAALVLKENVGTANHDARAAYAKKVLTNQLGEASRAAFFMTFQDNFINKDIDIHPRGNGQFSVVVATSEAEAESQVNDVWDKLVELFG